MSIPYEYEQVNSRGYREAHSNDDYLAFHDPWTKKVDDIFNWFRNHPNERFGPNEIAKGTGYKRGQVMDALITIGRLAPYIAQDDGNRYFFVEELWAMKNR